MEDASQTDPEELFPSAELLAWYFPWSLEFSYVPVVTFAAAPSFGLHNAHPIFGAHPAPMYYLPVIEEEELVEDAEAELPPTQISRIRIEEIENCTPAVEGVTQQKQQQRYIVEEPEEDDESVERKLESSDERDICQVVQKAEIQESGK